MTRVARVDIDASGRGIPMKEHEAGVTPQALAWADQHARQQKYVAAALFVVLACAVAPARRAWRLGELPARGVPVVATVVSPGGASKTEHARYAYTVHGQAYEGQVSVYRLKAPVGAELEALYHPEDPSLSRIDADAAVASARIAWKQVANVLLVFATPAVLVWGSTAWKIRRLRSQGVWRVADVVSPEWVGRGLVALGFVLLTVLSVESAWGDDAQRRFGAYALPLYLALNTIPCLAWWWGMPELIRFAAALWSRGRRITAGDLMALVVSGGVGDPEAERAATRIRAAIVASVLWFVGVVIVDPRP
jgi:hypothetical protein